ncbi:hypothetical protein HYZ64_00410 [Candidatus Berkelbacteria bacterium]|nr:hypothetical protein [Candidatus Berkelbacteria bacterium]
MPLINRYQILKLKQSIRKSHYLTIGIGLILGLVYGSVIFKKQHTQTQNPTTESVNQADQQPRASSPLQIIKDTLSGENKKLQEKLRAAELSRTTTQSNLDKTKTDLEKTLSDKKQLEEKVLTQEKSQVEVKAELTKTQLDLTKTQQSLEAKKTELSQLAKDLTGKQAEIDKAKRGLALFETMKSDLDQYQKFKVDALNKSLASISAQNNGDFTQAQSLLGEAATATKSANTYNDKVQDTISKIKSGNY